MSEEKESTKITAGMLRDWIKKEAGSKPADAPATERTEKTATDDTSLLSQVERALTSLGDRERARKRDSEVDQFLERNRKAKEAAQLEPQEAPVERRWIEKVMRWGD